MMGLLSCGPPFLRENGRMRPGNQNNKRMRGRGRKGPNPLSRTYESNGPDVKIRGTALHVAEKYQQLARDAQASGDRIMSENYYQHAEHYFRIVAAAQPQNQPSSAPQRQEAYSEEAAPEASGNGSAERPEKPEAESSNGSAAEIVTADSPQPYIESMPSIDASGQINGHAQAEGEPAGADEADEDAKPKRRTRGTRGRGVRKPAASEATAAEDGDVPVAAAEEEVKPKPRVRRAPRTRKVKEAEEAPAPEAPVASEA